MRMLIWFKKLRRIVSTYDENFDFVCKKADKAVRIIKQRTNVHIDMAMGGKDPNQVVVMGSYKGRDYVQTYSLHSDSFREIIEHLKGLQEYGTVKRIDAVMGTEAVLKYELDL